MLILRTRTILTTGLVALTLSACATTGTPDPTLTDPPGTDTTVSAEATPAPSATETPDATMSTGATGPEAATATKGPADNDETASVSTPAPEPKETTSGNPAASSDPDKWTTTDELLNSPKTTPEINKTIERVSIDMDAKITVYSNLERTKTKDTKITPARQAAVDLCQAAAATFRNDAGNPLRVEVLYKNGELSAMNTPKNRSYDICSWV